MDKRRIKQIVEKAMSTAIKTQYEGFSDDEIGLVEDAQDTIHKAINFGHDLWEIANKSGDEDKRKAWEEIITQLRNTQGLFDKATNASWVR